MFIAPLFLAKYFALSVPRKSRKNILPSDLSTSSIINMMSLSNEDANEVIFHPTAP